MTVQIARTPPGGRVAPMSVPARLLLGVLLILGAVLAAIDPFTLAFYASYAALGALLVVRRPRNAVGWLSLAIGASFIGTTVRGDLDVDRLVAGTAPLDQFLWAWIASWAGTLAFALIVALTVVFPHGRLPEGRWLRRVGAMLLVASATTVVLAVLSPTVSFNPDGGPESMVIPNRFGLLGWLPIWAVLTPDLLFAPVIPILVVAMITIVLRYRQATGILRLQLRWLVAAVSFVVLAVLVGLSSIALLPEDPGVLAWIPAIIAYPCVPIAIAVAVLRYRLYEIDRLISRTIGWALVTALLVGVFVGTIVALQAVLAPFTNNDTLAVAASTLFAAALFQPVRRRVQDAVDRRFNRSRVDAQRAVDAFGAQLRDEVDLVTIRGRLIVVADRAVQPRSIGLWMRGAAR